MSEFTDPCTAGGCYLSPADQALADDMHAVVVRSTCPACGCMVTVVGSGRDARYADHRRQRPVGHTPLAVLGAALFTVLTTWAVTARRVADALGADVADVHRARYWAGAQHHPTAARYPSDVPGARAGAVVR